MQGSGNNFIVDTGIHQFMPFDGTKPAKFITDDLGGKFTFIAADTNPGIGHFILDKPFNLLWSHKPEILKKFAIL